MKERPILFNGPMVRAILDGRKTQTRRVVKPQPDTIRHGKPFTVGGLPTSPIVCPHGQPGDRLWVRETFGAGARPCPIEGCVEGLEYRADEACIDEIEDLPLYQPEIPDDVECLDRWMGKWTPSIHMPRWASRITLEITDVRVERLQDISEEDAVAEGSRPYQGGWSNGLMGPFSHPILAFADLIDSLNGPGTWDANPWVWVMEFRVLEHSPI